MKCSRYLVFVVVGLMMLSCGGRGTPGVSGEIKLDSSILLHATASRIFVGAFSAEQLRSDAWPAAWVDAKYHTTIENVTARDFEYSFTTGSSERLYIYAFVDQNGDGATNPNRIDVQGELVSDALGRYVQNPVTPIDDFLKDIDIVVDVEAP